MAAMLNKKRPDYLLPKYSYNMAAGYGSCYGTLQDHKKPQRRRGFVVPRPPKRHGPSGLPTNHKGAASVFRLPALFPTSPAMTSSPAANAYKIKSTDKLRTFYNSLKRWNKPEHVIVKEIIKMGNISPQETEEIKTIGELEKYLIDTGQVKDPHQGALTSLGVDKRNQAKKRDTSRGYDDAMSRGITWDPTTDGDLGNSDNEQIAVKGNISLPRMHVPKLGHISQHRKPATSQPEVLSPSDSDTVALSGNTDDPSAVPESNPDPEDADLSPANPPTDKVNGGASKADSVPDWNKDGGSHPEPARDDVNNPDGARDLDPQGRKSGNAKSGSVRRGNKPGAVGSGKPQRQRPGLNKHSLIPPLTGSRRGREGALRVTPRVVLEGEALSWSKGDLAELVHQVQDVLANYARIVSPGRDGDRANSAGRWRGDDADHDDRRPKAETPSDRLWRDRPDSETPLSDADEFPTTSNGPQKAYMTPESFRELRLGDHNNDAAAAKVARSDGSHPDGKPQDSRNITHGPLGDRKRGDRMPVARLDTQSITRRQDSAGNLYYVANIHFIDDPDKLDDKDSHLKPLVAPGMEGLLQASVSFKGKKLVLTVRKQDSDTPPRPDRKHDGAAPSQPCNDGVPSDDPTKLGRHPILPPIGARQLTFSRQGTEASLGKKTNETSRIKNKNRGQQSNDAMQAGKAWPGPHGDSGRCGSVADSGVCSQESSRLNDVERDITPALRVKRQKKIYISP